MKETNQVPKWYVLSTLIIFIVIFVADIISKFVTLKQGGFLFFIQLIFFTVIVSIYMLFHLIFIIVNFKRLSVNGILIGTFAFLSLLIPILIAFLSENFEKTIPGFLLIYLFPVITMFFAFYLLKRRL